MISDAMRAPLKIKWNSYLPGFVQRILVFSGRAHTNWFIEWMKVQMKSKGKILIHVESI